MRILNLEDLAKSVETNMGSSRQAMYNIARVVVKIWEMVEDGVVRPPLNNYREVNKNIAILQSQYSECSKIFKLNAGHQSVPMCLVALGMTRLFPSEVWTAHILDKVMKLGDEYYGSSMVELEKNGLLDNEGDEQRTGDVEIVVPVTSENVLKTFNIGINKLGVEFLDTMEGNVGSCVGKIL